MGLTTQKLVFLILSLGSFAAERTTPEHRCSITEFQCESRKCIPMNLRCDGSTDCEDESDEKQCGAEPLLFYSTLEEIRVLNLKSGEELNVTLAVNPATAVDINQRNGRIYWVEKSSKPTIYSYEKDGNVLKAVLSNGLLIPQDIAVDYVANNIYITDSGLKQVLACKMDGFMCHVLHDTDVREPYSIELDLEESTMYWSDHGEQVHGIYKSGMDGSERKSFVTTGVQWPSGIAIDHTTDRLYWADAKLKKIEYITLDEKTRKVVQHFFMHFPISLTVFKDNIYWVDWEKNTLESCSKQNGVKLTLIDNGRKPRITGQKVYHPLLAVNVTNHCLSSGCQHMCILSPKKGFLCVCSRGFKLLEDHKTCIGPDAFLYFSTIGEINRVELNSMKHIISKKMKSWSHSFDVHPDNSQMYWVEMSKNETIIYAGNGNGTSMSILRHGKLYVEDIAVDYIANNLYITDMRFKEILVCRLDGAMCHVLHTEIGAPHSIALDLDSRLMYWSDSGDGFLGVHRSGMDGSGPISLVSNGIRKPYRIALDGSAQRLYWVDVELKRIEFIALKGSLRKVVLESEKYQPFALAVFEESVYWSDRLTFLVNSCNKFSGQNVTAVTQRSYSNIIKLRVLHHLSLVSKASNPCNNACSHMCLISPHGHICVCPKGFKLSKDGRTCFLESLDSAIFVSEESSVFYIRPQSLERDTWTKLPLPLDNINITSIAFDSKSKYLFVADVRKPAIFAVKLSSYEVQVLAGNVVKHPVDLAFDWSSNNLYWIDSSKRTAEVVSVYGRKSVVLLTMLQTPVALAISPSNGYMFIATSDVKQAIMKCGMDGGNQHFLDFSGDTRTLALHPSKRTLFWSDNQNRSVYFANYADLSQKKILKTGIDGLMSLAADENYVYYTAKTRGLNVFNGDETRVHMLPGEDKIPRYRQISYSPVRMTGTASGTSRCLQNNGDCSFLCLTSPTGKTCACPSDMLLDKDNLNCIHADGSSCMTGEVWCSPGKMCIPKKLICDGRVDCLNGVDEKYCDATTTTVSSNISSIIAGEIDNELIFMAEGPNIYIGVSNATGYYFKSHQSPLGPKATITSIIYEGKSDRLFVSEANRPAIHVLSADWKASELVVNGIISPKDIDFDWLSNNLYWADSIKGTVEVISVHNRKRIVLLEDLAIPVSIALSPLSDDMFVSTIGAEKLITVYAMDGKYKRIIHSVQGVPLSLVLHPSKTVLYWTDSRAGMIMYVNYTGSSSPWILKSGISGVMSVAVSKDNVYWTSQEMITPVVAGKFFVNRLSDQTDQAAWRSIALSKKKPFRGKSECLIDNGGCSYLCLTSHYGVTCSSGTTTANGKKM